MSRAGEPAGGTMSILDEASFWRAKAQQITPPELAEARVSAPQTAASIEMAMAELDKEAGG